MSIAQVFVYDRRTHEFLGDCKFIHYKGDGTCLLIERGGRAYMITDRECSSAVIDAADEGSSIQAVTVSDLQRLSLMFGNRCIFTTKRGEHDSITKKGFYKKP